MNKIFISIRSFCKNIIRKIKKIIFHNNIIYIITAYLFSVTIYLYVCLLKITCRIKIQFPKSYKNSPVIFCFWHGRMLMTIFARKKVAKISILLSKGKDAELIGNLMKWFKIGTIRGSTGRNRENKGGASSLKKMIKLLTKYKESIAIASDGPIGPLMRIMPGIAMLSLTTGTPVVPLALSAKHNKTLNTWDKFMLPLPFSKIIIKFGDPISPYDKNSKRKNLEQYRNEIEGAMVKLTQQLDKDFNLSLIQPSNLDKKKRPLTIKNRNN